MARNWTEKQREAIYAEGDLLVSAAAGAGKTAVLSERIARLIAEGTNPDELLVVTFTKAAAAEMKARIEARLSELAEEAASQGDEAAGTRLAAAAAACERASISTIHSFCTSVLRRNYHSAGIDPGFAVADTTRARLLADTALSAVLEEAFLQNERERDPEFDALMTAVGDDEKLAELVVSLHTYAMAMPDPEGWLQRSVDIYNDNFLSSADMITRRLMASAQRELQVHLDIAKRLCSELNTDEYKSAVAALQEDMSSLLSLILLRDYDSMHEALSRITFARLSWPRGVDEDFKKPFKDYRDSMKANVKKLEKLFAFPLSDEARFAAKLSGPVDRLRHLVLRFNEEFSRLKAEDGIIDFADMEQLTLRVLRDDDIAKEYRRRFKYVFIDEYQDINPAQEAILTAVSHGNRFMVGDVKQSIYRFRQAEPNIFLQKYASYNGDGGRKRIDLNRNFRSDGAVLDSANLLFSQLMLGEGVGEIDYSDNAALISGQEAHEPADGELCGSAELVLLNYGDGATPSSGADDRQDEADEYSEDDENASSIEAAYAVRRIREMMANNALREGDTLRPMRYSDFTVLLRSAKDSARRWISVLTDAGIPCVSDTGGGFFDAVEVRVFMDLLRIIDNRRQDIPLLAVMRSHVYSFTEEELIHIKADYQGDDMLDRVIAAAADEKQPGWSIKCSKLLEDTERWQQQSRLMSQGEFIGMLLDETNFEANCAALKGGEARGANLAALWECARRLNDSAGAGLHGFIAYMEQAKAAAAMEMPQTPFTDAVRIMTIHRSKGLEFPVVFLGGITRRFNRTASRQTGVFDPELGIGLCSVYGDRQAKCLLQRAIVTNDELRLNAEEMRVLYVAMTRAKNALIMLGAAKKAYDFAEKLMRPLDDVRIMHANTYADWLLGAYLPNGAESGEAEVPLPCGDKIKFGIYEAAGAESSSPGMEAEGFAQWRQEAAFADTTDIEKLFYYCYPSEEDPLLPSKLSVTGLTLHGAELAERPRFMQTEAPLTGVAIGTLTHRLLQLISLAPHTEESVKEELRALTLRGNFTPREAEVIKTESVLKFFNSPLGRRLLSSPRAEREREFNIMLPASELIGAGSSAPIMLQGIIDCCFIEDGAWVLIDHKTTRVEPNRTARTVAEQYRRQLELYAAALNKLTGIPVKQKYVYMLSVDEAVEL